MQEEKKEMRDNHREETWDWESPAVTRECGSSVKHKGRRRGEKHRGEEKRSWEEEGESTTPP